MFVDRKFKSYTVPFFIVSVVFPLICFMTVYQVPDGEISHGSAVG